MDGTCTMGAHNEQPRNVSDLKLVDLSWPHTKPEQQAKHSERTPNRVIGTQGVAEFICNACQTEWAARHGQYLLRTSDNNSE